MKKIFLLVLSLGVCSTSFAGLDKEAFYKAYREYNDRGVQLLPLSNDKIVIDRIIDIGKGSQGDSIYTVYMNIKIGSSQFSDAVQVSVEKNGEIDPYSGMFSISSTMIRDEKGNDARFPMGLNEVKYSQLAQKAFDVAQKQYAKFYLDPEYVGTFYIQTGSWNETDKTLSIEVGSRGLPGNKATAKMTQVTVEMDGKSGQVIKHTNRDY